jgi:hypothetical protein
LNVLIFINENVFVVSDLEYLKKRKVLVGSLKNEIIERINVDVLRDSQERILFDQNPKVNSVWLKGVLH